MTDDLHGQQFTCIAVAGDVTYSEAIEIIVTGILCYTGCSRCDYGSMN